jgi:hypothetical protein
MPPASARFGGSFAASLRAFMNNAGLGVPHQVR